MINLFKFKQVINFTVSLFFINIKHYCLIITFISYLKEKQTLWSHATGRSAATFLLPSST